MLEMAASSSLSSSLRSGDCDCSTAGEPKAAAAIGFVVAVIDVFGGGRRGEHLLLFSLRGGGVLLSLCLSLGGGGGSLLRLDSAVASQPWRLRRRGRWQEGSSGGSSLLLLRLGSGGLLLSSAAAAAASSSASSGGGLLLSLSSGGSLLLSLGSGFSLLLNRLGRSLWRHGCERARHGTVRGPYRRELLILADFLRASFAPQPWRDGELLLALLGLLEVRACRRPRVSASSPGSRRPPQHSPARLGPVLGLGSGAAVPEHSAALPRCECRERLAGRRSPPPRSPRRRTAPRTARAPRAGPPPARP